MQRRIFINQLSIIGAGSLLAPGFLRAAAPGFPVVRVAKADRKFNSPAIEQAIQLMKKRLGDTELAWLFENCFPNTLDTTVDFDPGKGEPDTYVITGDIDAMWLRDSSAQVWPYLPFMKEDPNLKQLIRGVVRRQVQCILLDPYANAFYKDPDRISEWKDDLTDMRPGIHERKWEVDSLCYPIRLAHGYFKATGDTSIFTPEWQKAMSLVLKTFRDQQRLHDQGPYHFQRRTSWATDGVPMGGYGYPTKKIGLIHSMFRPSDDATIYPFFIPGNFFAAHSLGQLATMAGKAGNNNLANEAAAFSKELKKILEAHAPIKTSEHGTIYAYEINGAGSFNLMDDANVPSLLSLPYLVEMPQSDPVYLNTRRYILSGDNPFFFEGRAGAGIGGPHVGLDMIWPLSLIMRAMTSSNDQEIGQCLHWLQRSNAGTGFMHESFHKDDASKYTRKWFAWANTLFGELVLKIAGERPHLLKS